jgi:hypothetical protein
MASWGDVNAALNGLVRAGAISAFRSNLGDPDRAGPIEVAVTPVGQQDEQQVRGAVLRAMARLGLLATVTVEQAGQGPSGEVENDAGP